MEFLIGLGVLVLFALLAARFGYDSRPALHSSEHDLASRGVVWPRRPSPARAGNHDAQETVATPASEAVPAASTVEQIAA